MTATPSRSIQKNLAIARRNHRDQLFYAFVKPYLKDLPQTHRQKLTIQYPPQYSQNQIRHQWRKHFEGDFATAGRFKLAFTPDHNGWILTISRKDFPEEAFGQGVGRIISTQSIEQVGSIIPQEPYIAPWIREAEAKGEGIFGDDLTPEQMEQLRKHQEYMEDPFSILTRTGYEQEALNEPPPPNDPPPVCPNSDNTSGEEQTPQNTPNECPLNPSEEALLNLLDETEEPTNDAT